MLVRGTFEEPPTGLIPWFSKTEGNTYATLLYHPFLFKGKPTQCSRGSKKDLWRRCRGVYAKVNIPSTHHKLISLAFTLFVICLSFSFPPLHPRRFIHPLFPNLLLSFSLAFFVCLCVGLLVAMAQANNKLCDFSNTNNNDFLSTPITPLNDVEYCEINTALLNLL